MLYATLDQQPARRCVEDNSALWCDGEGWYDNSCGDPFENFVGHYGNLLGKVYTNEVAYCNFYCATICNSQFRASY